MRSKKALRYVVSRLKNPEDLEGEREMIGCHPCLELAKKQADSIGPDAFVDAEGGTYPGENHYRQRGSWRAEWINRDLYQGRKKRSVLP